MSQQHREALAHLLYGVGEGGGFVQLTGEVGTGKTTISRCLVEQLPDHVDIALILNPRVTALELVASLCDELRIQYSKETTSIKSLIDLLNAHLLSVHAKGRRTVLLIDEAQNLSVEVLEQVRLLTNLETTREKLLQIILIGQPELRELLARDELRQLSQRITARYHLDPINRSETAAYIRHRLQVCGNDDSVFDERAIDLIHKLSTGVPRLINVLCDRAMLGAFVESKQIVDAAIVRKAAREVLPEEGLDAPKYGLWRWLVVSAAFFAAAAGSYLLLAPDRHTVTAQLVAKPLQPPMERGPVQRQPVNSALVAEAASTTAEQQSGHPLAVSLAQAGPGAAARAWASLFRSWGVQASVGSEAQACRQASTVGLQCLQGAAGWAELKSYDRPAVLLLLAGQGRRVPVVLKQTTGLSVRLEVDGRELDVPVDELERHWSGEYRLLWKAPPAGSVTLRAGDRGGDVKWLRDQLQQVTGLTSIAPDPRQFGAGLQELLKSFQRSHELNADGVAGARTFIYLNNLTGQQPVPRLRATAASG
jgi:general secretion pathway protein A